MSNRTFVALCCCLLPIVGCGPGSRGPSGAGNDSETEQAISVLSFEPSDAYAVAPRREDPAPEAPVDEAPQDDDAVAEGQPILDDVFHRKGWTPLMWSVNEWADDDPVYWASLRGQVAVIHFFDVDAEASRRTMQALQRLHEEFGDRPVVFIGILRTERRDPGPPWEQVVGRVRDWGVTFPITRDDRGITLARWWFDYFDHVPDTPTLVLGPDCRIAYVHPGPEFFPTDDLMFALCDRDYRAIELAIRTSMPQDVARRP